MYRNTRSKRTHMGSRPDWVSLPSDIVRQISYSMGGSGHTLFGVCSHWRKSMFEHQAIVDFNNAVQTTTLCTPQLSKLYQASPYLAKACIRNLMQHFACKNGSDTRICFNGWNKVTLYCEACIVRQVDFNINLRPWYTLQHLNISCSIPYAELSKITLELSSQLKTLIFTAYQGECAWANGTTWKKLEKLDLSNSKMSGICKMLRQTEFPALQYLNLDNCDIMSSGLTVLLRSKWIPQLKVLSLCNQLDNWCVQKLLSKCIKFDNLAYLALGTNDDDLGIQSNINTRCLASLATMHLPKIESIFFGSSVNCEPGVLALKGAQWIRDDTQIVLRVPPNGYKSNDPQMEYTDYKFFVKRNFMIIDTIF